MPKLTFSNLLNNQAIITGVADRDVTYIDMDDLRTINIIGGTVRIDDGTDDNLFGTNGNDRITVHNGNDTVHAGASADIIKDLGNGNDQFFGEGGNDIFELGSGNDFVDGGDGLDTISYANIDFTVIADLGKGFIFADGIDQVTNVENITASKWNDTLTGNGASNVLRGMGGDDILRGGGGRDILFGGDGNDDISGKGAMYGGNGDDIITSEFRRRGSQGDTLFGEAGEDTMSGNSGNDKIFGGADDDVINGGAGEDYIHGGSGINILSGGLDRDVFAFESFGIGHGFDQITDFEVDYDRIDLTGIDADPTQDGHQDFFFSNRALRFHDDVISATNSPALNGSIGRVSSKIDDGHTYVYVQTQDGYHVADIVLNGEFTLTADNFIL